MRGHCYGNNSFRKAHEKLNDESLMAMKIASERQAEKCIRKII